MPRAARHPGPLTLLLGFPVLCATIVHPSSDAEPARVDPQPHNTHLGSSPDDLQFTLLVTDDHDRPLPGARLWLELDHPAYPQCVDPSARRMALLHTDAEGLATVWYPAKKAAIVATATGYAPQLLRDADLARQKPFPIRLSPGVSLTGRVSLPDQAPAANVEVSATPNHPVLRLFDEFKLTACTTPDGAFTLPHAGPHTYTLTARIDTDAAAPFHVEPVQVQVTPGAAPAPLALSAQPAGSIHGIFISAHEVPVANLNVHTLVRLPKTSQWPTKSAADGSFALHGIPPGSRGQILFNAPRGYAIKIDLPADQPFLRPERSYLTFDNVPPGRHEGLTLRLLKEATVSGTVTDEQGAPVAEVFVATLPTNSIFKTDAAGRFEARIPPLEDITLEISRDGKAENLTRPTVRAAEGEKLSRDLTVKRIDQTPPDGTIAGRVVDADDKPVPRASVYLGNYTLIPPRIESASHRGPPRPGQKDDTPKPTWRGGNFFPTVLTADDEGRFTFNYLHTGVTDLWAESPTGDTGWSPQIKTGASDVTVRLSPRPETVTVTGTLLDPAGAPATGARVLLFNGDHSRPALLAESKTESDGRFTLSATPGVQTMRHLRLLCDAAPHPVAWRRLPQTSVNDVTVRLLPGATLTGRAVNDKGEPVAGARVWLYLADHSDYGRMFFFRASERFAPSVETRADGTFTLGRLPRGSTASIKIKHPTSGTGDHWYAKDLDGDRRLDNIKLPAGVTVEGVVRRAGTGEPVADAKVALSSFGDEGAPATTTTLGGRFSLAGLDRSYFSNEYASFSATAGGAPPQWEGETRLTSRLYAGDSLGGIEILVDRSFDALHAEWKAQPGTPAQSSYRVAVLDNADPAYSGKAKYDDTLTLFDAQGKTLWQHKGFNIAQSVGGNHAMAFSPADRSLWVVETVGGRLLNFDADTGKVNWEKPSVKGHAVAVDPKTGNGWVLTADGTIYGKDLLVFSPAGEPLATHKVNAFDIVYSARSDCFWLAGRKGVKLDREGKILFETPQPFAWLAPSVSVNESDGTAWVLESQHPQVAGSTGKVIAFAPDGRRLAEVPNEGACVAADGARQAIWVSGRTVQRLGLDAKPTGTLPLRAFSLAIEPDTGSAWAAGHDAVSRVDSQGKLVWEHATPGGSQKWLCIVPPR